MTLGTQTLFGSPATFIGAVGGTNPYNMISVPFTYTAAFNGGSTSSVFKIASATSGGDGALLAREEARQGPQGGAHREGRPRPGAAAARIPVPVRHHQDPHRDRARAIPRAVPRRGGPGAPGILVRQVTRRVGGPARGRPQRRPGAAGRGCPGPRYQVSVAEIGTAGSGGGGSRTLPRGAAWPGRRLAGAEVADTTAVEAQRI